MEILQNIYSPYHNIIFGSKEKCSNARLFMSCHTIDWHPLQIYGKKEWSAGQQFKAIRLHISKPKDEVALLGQGVHDHTTAVVDNLTWTHHRLFSHSRARWRQWNQVSSSRNLPTDSWAPLQPAHGTQPSYLQMLLCHRQHSSNSFPWNHGMCQHRCLNLQNLPTGQ